MASMDICATFAGTGELYVATSATHLRVGKANKRPFAFASAVSCPKPGAGTLVHTIGRSRFYDCMKSEPLGQIGGHE